MKHLKLFITFFSLMILGVSCIKNEEAVINTSTLEFDAAGYNSFAATKDYPVLPRVSGYGRAFTTSDPLIKRTSGTIKFRVNLQGKQQSTAISVPYVVVADETVSGAIAAVRGTDYEVSGTVTIPADSNFGEVEVQIKNGGAAVTTNKLIVLELNSTDAIKVNPNYKRIGILINKD